MGQPTVNSTRIVLVNPPFRYFPKMKHTLQSYTRPPLGIAYIASFFREYFTSPTDIILFDVEACLARTTSSVLKFIIGYKPDIVGFTTVTGTCTAVGEIATGIKAIDKNILTVAGGPHSTAIPEEPIPGIDAKFVGEAEISFLEFVSAYLKGDIDQAVDGCIRFVDGQVVWRGGDRELIEPLDRIPIPARELFEKNDYYHSFPYRGVRKFTTMFTSRGCPYSCSFCGNEVIWKKKVRFHTLERVREELNRITKDGYNLVFFDDDTFNFNRERTIELCGIIRKEFPELRWICHIRADRTDEQLLEAMSRAGCIEVQVGVESGDEDVLRGMDKRLTLDEVRRTFRALRKVSINSWATFVFGAEGETPESIERSIAFAKEIDPGYCTFILALPFPGSRLFDVYRKGGHIKTYDWSAYSWHGDPVINLPNLTGNDLVEWRKRAFREFYLRPSKLLEIIWLVLKAVSFREMSRNFFAWYSLTFTAKKRRRLAGIRKWFRR